MDRLKRILFYEMIGGGTGSGSDPDPETKYSITLTSNVPNAVFTGLGLNFVNGVAEVDNPGTYTVQCSASGYITQQAIVVLSEEEPQKSVHFELEEIQPEIEYSITVSSNVANAVFESNGLTFDNGVAEVDNPGTYTIQCSAPGYITQQATVVLSEQEPQKSVYFELEAEKLEPYLEPAYQAQEVNVGAYYESTAFTAHNFTKPFSYKIIGVLPEGISLDSQTGVLSGTSSEVFSGIIKILAFDDDNSETAEAEVFLEVKPVSNAPLGPEDFGNTSITGEIVDQIKAAGHQHIYHEELGGVGSAYIQSKSTELVPVVSWRNGNKYVEGVQAWDPSPTVTIEKSEYNNLLQTVGRDEVKKQVISKMKEAVRNNLFERTNCILAFNDKRHTEYKPIDINRLKNPALGWHNYQSNVYNLDYYYPGYGIDISTSVLTSDEIYNYITAMVINNLYPDWSGFEDFVGITVDYGAEGVMGYGISDMLLQLEIDGILTSDSIVFDEEYNNNIVLPIVEDLTSMREVDRIINTNYLFSSKISNERAIFQTVDSLSTLKTWVNNIFDEANPADIILLGPKFYSSFTGDSTLGAKPKIEGLNVRNVLVQPTGEELDWIIEGQTPEEGQIPGERIYVGDNKNSGAILTPETIDISEGYEYDYDEETFEEIEREVVEFYCNYVVSQWNNYNHGDISIDRRKNFMYYNG